MIILVSLLVGILRFAVPGHDLSWPGTYEAFAHIWVGALLVFCFDKSKRTIAISSLSVITVLEAVMFVLR